MDHFNDRAENGYMGLVFSRRSGVTTLHLDISQINTYIHAYIHTYIHTYKHNLKEAYRQKEIKYILLIAEMQRMYSDYKFSTSVISIGALGAALKNLDLNLRKLNFEKEKIAVLIQRIQRAALTGTLKVCKMVRKMLNQE